ncbi:MAG: hypothetical protein AABZ60_17190, partial [Planctomycetota bacterium]
DGVAINYEPPMDTEILGEAKSSFVRKTKKITSDRIINKVSIDYVSSSVYFNFSDHGGDNFIIRASLLKNEEPIIDCFVETGMLTVWRKRCVEIMAMQRYISNTRTTRDTHPTLIPGNFYPLPNFIVEFSLEFPEIVKLKFDKHLVLDETARSEFERKTGSVFPEEGFSLDLTRKQQADNVWAFSVDFEINGEPYILNLVGAENLSIYKKTENDAKKIRKILQEGYTPKNANGKEIEDRNTYIDFFVENATQITANGKDPQNLPASDFYGGNADDLTKYIKENIENENSLPYTDKIRIIGVGKLFDSYIQETFDYKKNLGDTLFVTSSPNPNIYIPTPYIFIEMYSYNYKVFPGFIKELQEKLPGTIIHEMAHRLIYQLDRSINPDGDFIVTENDVHTIHDGKCALETKNKDFTTEICPRHVRLLRNSLQRTFWNPSAWPSTTNPLDKKTLLESYD